MKKEYRYECRFNPAGILCDDRTKCPKCGWNPEVELKRKKKLQELEKEGWFGTWKK